VPVMLSSSSIFSFAGHAMGEVVALSSQDEDMGRAIVATLAWGTACEALGHADEMAQTHPTEFSLARADAARVEVARTRDVLNEALAAI
jgi:hypothetical protein